MFWSILKVLIFLGLAALVAFGAAWLLDSPGEITIAFAGRELALTPLGFVISLMVLLLAALVILKLIGLIGAVLRFLLGDETAISRYFSRSRERRGLDALSDGLVALAEDDPKTAIRQAGKADKLLRRPDMTRIVSARAAELAGDRALAYDTYKAMLESDRTRFAGIKGLMKHKLEEGDTDTALALADKAVALRPDNPDLLRTLFELQSRKADWAGARRTLNASMKARMLPRDIGTRRDAVLSLADARAALEAGDMGRGNEAALQANKLAPTLVPAAALAARVQAAKGAKRKAVRILTSAWGVHPQPELAAAFAALEPDETPDARRRRFATLTAAAPDHIESRLLSAELALAAEDFPAARKALGDLPETQPTTRSLALMAAVERGQGAPEAVVRGWLAKALGASRGPQWICERCNSVHASWAPVCQNCGAFDTLAWKTAPNPDNAGLNSAAMLPLVIADPAPPPPAPEPEPDPEPAPAAAAPRPEPGPVMPPPRPDIVDAEFVDGPAEGPRRR